MLHISKCFFYGAVTSLLLHSQSSSGTNLLKAVFPPIPYMNKCSQTPPHTERRTQICKQTQSKNIHKNIYSSPASIIPGLHFVCLYLVESPLIVWFLLMLNPTPPLQVSKSLLLTLTPYNCPSLWRPILSSSDAAI